MIEGAKLQLSGALQMRGGVSTALTSENPVLARREIAVEVDTGRMKVGDGVHSWNELDYANAGDGISSLPPIDDKIYAIKNGEYVSIMPEIEDTGDIVFVVNKEMTGYQFTVKSSEDDA